MKYSCEGCKYAPYDKENTLCTRCGQYVFSRDCDYTKYVYTHWQPKDEKTKIISDKPYAQRVCCEENKEEELQDANDKLKELLRQALQLIDAYKGRAKKAEIRCNELDRYLELKYKDY